jgi:hypothetical protein
MLTEVRDVHNIFAVVIEMIEEKISLLQAMEAQWVARG